MSPIPESTLPGHQRAHERVTGALDLLQEFPWVEFKESRPWEDLKIKITSTSLAMANLREGGILVVGVREDGDSWELQGVDAAHLPTYDEDDVNDFVNRYASPALRVELLLVPYDGKRFLAVRVPEFSETPVVCKRNGPTGSPLREGAIFVRPPGKPQTTRVAFAAELHDLLELAAEKRARELLRAARRVGFEVPTSESAKFDEELGDL